jgi:hypothetical protein
MTFGNSLAVVLVAAASVTQLFQFGGKVFGGEDLPQGEVRSNVGARVETPLAGAGEALHSSPSEPALSKCQPCVCPDSDRTEGFFSDPWEATALAGASGLALTVGALARRGRRAAPAQAVAQHGRGAVLRDARIAQRQRLQAVAAGQLVPAVV